VILTSIGVSVYVVGRFLPDDLVEAWLSELTPNRFHFGYYLMVVGADYSNPDYSDLNYLPGSFVNGVTG